MGLMISSRTLQKDVLIQQPQTNSPQVKFVWIVVSCGFEMFQ